MCFSENDTIAPVIIFDTMGFVHLFGTDSDEVILGGRHNVYLRTVTDFFTTLVENGAKLVFFCDGQVRSEKMNEWCNRRNEEYQRSIYTLHAIDNGIHQMSDKRCGRGCKNIVNCLLKTVEQFGEIITTSSTDCDAAIANYAVANNALAVIANDSDFLIYDGNWQFWDGNCFNLNRLTTKCFKRNILRRHLNLTSDEMKLFATMSGNDYTKHILRNDYPNKTDFRKIANLCQSLRLTFDMKFYRLVTSQLCEPTNDAIEIVKNSIESYRIDVTAPIGNNKLEKYTLRNVLMDAILKENIFQYSVNFLEFQPNGNNNSDGTFFEKLLKTFRKLSGTLLKDKIGAKPIFKILTKYSAETPYQLLHEIPIFPKCMREQQLIKGKSVKFFIYFYFI